MSYKLPEGYKIVHIGGHHTVYCNGKAHIWTTGGYALIQRDRRLMREGVCDCSKYEGAVLERD